MSVHALPTTAPAEVLTAAQEVVRELDDRLWVGVTDEDLVEGLEALLALEAHLAAIRSEMLAETDSRQVPRRLLHWASTADWWSCVAGLSRGDARRAVAVAHDLVGDRSATLEALRGGTVSDDQAGVVCRAVADLPGDPGLRDRAEGVLLDSAVEMDATGLARAGRYVLSVVDPDRAGRRAEAALDRGERAAHLQRSLSITDDGAGGVRVRGRGSVEDAAILRAALLPLTKPAPVVDLETGAPLERDPRDHGVRMWDALVTVAQHSLDTEAAPESHGARPRVTVTIDLDSLRGDGVPGEPGATDDGLELSAATIRRLACDADIIPVALGTPSTVLDVGRRHRTCPHHLWLALVARDRHCTFPGCTRPPVMGHAHHVVHWAEGGRTSLDNLVLLCGEHHRVVHHSPWEVRLSPRDGRPEFKAPPRSRDTDPPGWKRRRSSRRPRAG